MTGIESFSVDFVYPKLLRLPKWGSGINQVPTPPPHLQLATDEDIDPHRRVLISTDDSDLPLWIWSLISGHDEPWHRARCCDATAAVLASDGVAVVALVVSTYLA